MHPHSESLEQINIKGLHISNPNMPYFDTDTSQGKNLIVQVLVSAAFFVPRSTHPRQKQTCNTAVFVLIKTDTQSHSCESTLFFFSLMRFYNQ